MKKILSFTFVLAVSVAALAAQNLRIPDNDDIFNKIINGSSPFYYPSLMLRYEAGDTTLTAEDYHYLYYGYAYQDNYKPLEPISAETDMLVVLDRAGEDPTPLQLNEMIFHGREVMKADPFSPKNINFLTYAYQLVGDTVNAKIFNDKFGKILYTIESSGTGLKENSPWHVLWFSHASDVIASRGLSIRSRQIRTRSVEYIMLEKKDGEVPGYFFDFGRMYWRRPENLPKKEKRVQGFELNGIPIGRNKSTNTDTPAR